ncbi:hypothetical protein BDN72DRAFT_780022, partial [Pluteus cervinus]
DSRGDDVRRMKGSSAKWINEQQPTPDPLLSPDHRRNRGIEHPVCGRLLCPAHHDWDDPIVRARVQLQEEGYRLSESFFVACFYKEYECDKNDVEKGFLQSSLLVFGFRDIFTGPKSVDAPVVDEIDAPVEGAHKRSRRGGVAGLLKMDEVTPRSIAYVACLLHFNLTNASEWSEEYYGVNYHAMYDFIVDYFEDPGSEEAKTHVNNLLRWWNRYVHCHCPLLQSTNFVSQTDLPLSRKAHAKQLTPNLGGAASSSSTERMIGAVVVTHIISCNRYH